MHTTTAVAIIKDLQLDTYVSATGDVAVFLHGPPPQGHGSY